MNIEERMRFINYVKSTVQKYPDVAGDLFAAINKGISDRLKQEQEVKSDLEAALTLSLHRSKGANASKKAVAEILKRNKENLRFNYAYLLDDLELKD